MSLSLVLHKRFLFKRAYKCEIISITTILVFFLWLYVCVCVCFCVRACVLFCVSALLCVNVSNGSPKEREKTKREEKGALTCNIHPP